MGYLTPAQAAERIGVARTTILDALYHGILKRYFDRPEGQRVRVLVDVAELDRLSGSELSSAFSPTPARRRVAYAA